MLGVDQPVPAQRGNPEVQFDGQTIDQMVAAFMKQHRIPGMTLAIVQAPYIPRVVGYGVSDVDKGLLASPKTLWPVGQMTQAYTAVAVMQLIESDKVALDDPVGKHLANLPLPWRDVAVRQLMAHVSGLPDYTKQPSFQPDKEYQADEVIALVKGTPLAFRPGDRVANSATDFFLLGLVVERASGMSYEDFVTKNQIERLGLKNTMFAPGLSAVKSETVETTGGKHQRFLQERPYINPTEPATGYTEEDGKRTAVRRNSHGAWYAHGGILASAEDVSFWDMGLAGSQLVSKKENRDFLYHGVKLNDTTEVRAHCGWRFPGHKGLMDIQGNIPGFSCYLSRFTAPSELVCVTLCANKEGVDLTELARRIAGAFDSKLGPPVSPDVMMCLESCYPVGVTADRLAEHLQAKGVEVVARIDHAAAAGKKGLTLAPTEVVLFGNPAVGTQLMFSRRSVALDLPLRVLVWEEPDGTVWVGYHDLAQLARQQGIADRAETVEAMNAGVIAALRHATAPY